jgi:hypothetical protein
MVQDRENEIKIKHLSVPVVNVGAGKPLSSIYRSNKIEPQHIAHRDRRSSRALARADAGTRRILPPRLLQVWRLLRASAGAQDAIPQRNGWTITRHGVPMCHVPPDARDRAERFARDPVYRRQLASRKMAYGKSTSSSPAHMPVRKIASTIEPVQNGRIFVELVNAPFLKADDSVGGPAQSICAQVHSF